MLLVELHADPAVPPLRLGAEARVTVGRGATCDLRLDHPEVAELQGEVQVVAEGVLYEDLTAGAPSFVEPGHAPRHPTGLARLGSGDRLSLAGRVPMSVLVFEREQGIAGGCWVAAVPVRLELPVLPAVAVELLGLARDLRGAHDARWIVERGGDALRASLPADCVVGVLDAPTGRGPAVSGPRRSAEPLGGAPDPSLLGRAWSGRMALLVRPEDPSATPRSTLIVPVLVSGRTRALLVAERSAGELDGRHLEVAMVVANELGRGLEDHAAWAELEERARGSRTELAVLTGERLRSLGSCERQPQSSAMRRLWRALDYLAGQPVPVLVAGPDGSRRELYAAALHQASAAGDRPFVHRLLTAGTAEQVSEELFGGGARSAPPLLASLGEGTLFLDLDAPPGEALAWRLARLARHEEVWLNGEATPRRATLRLVCGVRSIERASTLLPPDLRSVLTAFPLVVPPLAERPEDIGGLLEVLREDLAARLGRAVGPFEENAVACIERHGHRGDRVALELIVARAAALAPDGGAITEDLLPEDLRLHGRPQRLQDREQELSRLRDTIESFEARLLADALDRHGGRRGATAAYLGISRVALVNKMKKYAI